MSSAHSGSPEAIRSELGAILRDVRERSRRTLSEVAVESDCSPAYLSEIERGRKDVSTDRLVAIVHALGLPIGSLYAKLGEAFSPRNEPAWPHDPRQQIKRASASLTPDALRTVAQFSVFLASTPQQPTRRIGFVPPGER